ncbi:MAG: DUF58 domain-containing protein [Candidatus Thermoplasmatota archaeon]|nr:DUF58 domain-containing protein [Candidatus Thermoplasmatota archaeon]MCL5785686.1 DUF58 domain-containing protein [Candidatus Thermoplasmatota archaeon]
MIKKSGYLFLGTLMLGIFEGMLMGFVYFLIFSSILFFSVASEIILFNVYTTSGLRSMDVARFVDTNYVRKGGKLGVRLKFHNKSSRKIAFHYYDTLSDVFTISGPSEGYISLSGGETREIDYALSAWAVGKYAVGPVIVYSEDPMKLCVSSYKLEKSIDVKVSPSLSEITNSRSGLVSNIKFTSGIHKSRVIGQGYNFYGVRPYVISDEFRYIAWSRYGIQTGEDIYIKQMEEERQLDVYFVLDYSESSNFGYKTKRMYDRMIVSSINAAYMVLKNRDGAGFLLYSSVHDAFIPVTRSDESIRKLETKVAEIRPEGRFDLMRCLQRAGEEIKKNALIILVSPMFNADQFRSPHGSLFRVGKRFALILLSPTEFVEWKDEDKNYTTLMRSALVSRSAQIKQISRSLNQAGLKTIVAEDSTLQRRLAVEYQYEKMVQ